MKPSKTMPAQETTKKSPGFCIVCGAVATTQAFFKVPGAVIVQRYCDKCLPKADYDAKGL